MLFFTFEFLYVFLPITLIGFFLLGSSVGRQAATFWLVSASLFFYGNWNPAYVYLLVGSMLINYGLGRWLQRRPSVLVLTLGIAINLGLIGYYKYSRFLLDSVNHVVWTGFTMESILLPLAISFFTFQQIAWLVDSYSQKVDSTTQGFWQYALFVTFFPQLIAGPIVHHGEMMPQFARKMTFKPRSKSLAVGLTIFTIGLFKKVIIADTFAPLANLVFDKAAVGQELSAVEAWTGAWAYTLQLYFDFSGYADMAIGLARMFNIRLPLNFNSPYKAISISDFWQRWHMTLSRFFRDYLYFPLGGNRRGIARSFGNLMITMLLGGLWHGAGWTFVFWGGLHGLCLVINHAWRMVRIPLPRVLAWGLTLLAVVVGWVFFRAESFSSAMIVLQGMVGINGLLPNGPVEGIYRSDLAMIGGTMAIALVAPNTQQIMRGIRPALDFRPSDRPVGWGRYLLWRPSLHWLCVTCMMAVVCIYYLLDANKVQEFIYFQF